MATNTEMTAKQLIDRIKEYGDMFGKEGERAVNAIWRLERNTPNADDIETLDHFADTASAMISSGKITELYLKTLLTRRVRGILLQRARDGTLDELVLSTDRPFAELSVNEMEADIHKALSARGEVSLRGAMSFLIEHAGKIGRSQLLNGDYWSDRFLKAHQRALGGGAIEDLNLKKAYELYDKGGEFPEEQFAGLLSIWLMLAPPERLKEKLPASLYESALHRHLSPLPVAVEQFALNYLAAREGELTTASWNRSERISKTATTLLRTGEDLTAEVNDRGYWPHDGVGNGSEEEPAVGGFRARFRAQQEEGNQNRGGVE